MAIGLGKMFGFDLLENFNFPYIARSIQEFWRRWHISLSTWFRDYLYIPLGGNRVGKHRVYFNLFIVFLLTGFWHGASWNFIVWGLFHGLFLIIERVGFGKFLEKLWSPIRHFYTLFVVLISWVFFRADDLPYALSYLKTMFGAREINSEFLDAQQIFKHRCYDSINCCNYWVNNCFVNNSKTSHSIFKTNNIKSLEANYSLHFRNNCWSWIILNTSIIGYILNCKLLQSIYLF